MAVDDWPDRRLLDLLGIELPILQAPMAGPNFAALAAAVTAAGGLGALPCAMLTPADIEREWSAIRARTAGPVNLNFFAHEPAPPDAAADAAWRTRLAPHYRACGLDPASPWPGGGRAPFDETSCALVERLRPAVVSFHFGLPAPALLARVRASGARILATATSVAEARWLAARGCDAVIAQGAEAGGHRGTFLTADATLAAASQVGTFALLPQVVDAVDVPVIAAGGIADGRGIAAAFALGAAAVQIGTAYLYCPEAQLAAAHRAALAQARDDGTVLTNVFSGRPARGLVNHAIRELGPLAAEVPAFPRAAAGLAALRAAHEARGSTDFTPLWAGQAAALGRRVAGAASADVLTRRLAADARACLARLTRGRH